MKVHISYTVEVDEEFRRALNAYYGKPGLATRADVRQWYKMHGPSCDNDMLAAYDAERKAG